jgi:hypothetical protein
LRRRARRAPGDPDPEEVAPQRRDLHARVLLPEWSRLVKRCVMRCDVPLWLGFDRDAAIQNNVPPEAPEAFDSSDRGTPCRRIADEYVSAKHTGFRLKQGIEISSASCGEGMRRSLGIYQLASQHLQLLLTIASPLEVRKMCMEIQSHNAPHQSQPIAFGCDFDGCGGTVGHSRGMETKAIPHRQGPFNSEMPKSPKLCRAGMPGSPW